MSDEEQSADNKSFLARWSQRKHEAKQPDRDAPTVNADAPSGPVAESDVAQEFDLSSLPKLEDMTATTDITAFLRKGVPEHLRNAALRKSWALDPAIRNYVNPALDYAYDWNTPGGVPGNSEIGAGMDVARLVSQIMGTGETAIEPSAPTVENPAELASDPAPSGEPQSGPPEQPLRLSSKQVPIGREPTNREEGTPVQAGQAEHSKASDSAAPQHAARRHGSAKPTI